MSVRGYRGANIQINAVEAGRLGMVVCVDAAQESLQEEQPRNYQEIPGRGLLCRGQANFFGRRKRRFTPGCSSSPRCQ